MTTVTGEATSDRPLPTELPLSRSSVAWRVNAEPAVFLGGGRALLLQVAHPGVGAGVEQHSTYASDPWGRLFRTVDVMMKLSFGSPEVSARQQRMLAKMHRRVVGVDDAGERYDAMDPGLQLWVWGTLIDTSVAVYELVHGALTPDEKERFYQESTLVAHGCGVPRDGCPASWGEFQAYKERVIAEDLRVTDAARSVAAASMVPPLPAPFGRVAAVPNQLVTVGLLPPSVREQYGFEWDAAKERQLRQFLSAAAVASRTVPRSVREAGARLAVSRKQPLKVPWLQRRGAELTARRLAELRRVDA